MDHPNLTLRAALAQNRLEDFVAQEETRGVEIRTGSDFERAVALLSVRGLEKRFALRRTLQARRRTTSRRHRDCSLSNMRDRSSAPQVRGGSCCANA